MPARNDERREQIRRLREQGLSFKEVGERLDPPIKAPTVIVTAMRMGLPGRIKLVNDGRGKNRGSKSVDMSSEQA